MVNFTHEYSNYPSEVIEKHNFKDPDGAVADMITRIKSLRTAGLHQEAADLIEKNKDALKPYLIDTALINELIEQIRNTQIYALSAKQCIYTAEAPPYAPQDNDVWIGGN